MLQEIIKNKIGSATLMALLILFGILAIAVVGINIMLSGFQSYLHQGASAIAYYAAESGIERALLLYKLEPTFFHKHCSDGNYIYFGYNNQGNTRFQVSVNNSQCSANKQEYTYIDSSDLKFKTGNEPTYYVRVKQVNDTNDPCTVIIRAVGSYFNTQRAIEVNFCVPD